MFKKITKNWIFKRFSTLRNSSSNTFLAIFKSLSRIFQINLGKVEAEAVGTFFDYCFFSTVYRYKSRDFLEKEPRRNWHAAFKIFHLISWDPRSINLARELNAPLELRAPNCAVQFERDLEGALRSFRSEISRFPQRLTISTNCYCPIERVFRFLNSSWMFNKRYFSVRWPVKNTQDWKRLMDINSILYIRET